MSIINILPEAVANRIAAGEVVERPASVVKELLENSLDAAARRIEISVEAGGKRLVRVVDDGQGMTHDDALLAFERHATSKIRTADDLFQVVTLGFRGEALPSIAAVSRLVLETRDASEGAGTRVEIAGGKLRDVKEVAWPQGTRVEVRDLFYVTPARRKFLKADSTELGHIATVATHYALAYPDKGFRLASFTHEILNVSPVATYRERLYQVLGEQTLEQLLEIAPTEREVLASAYAGPDEEAEDERTGARVRVEGFVSRPEVHKLNRNHIYFFVNRRLVRDRLVLHALTEAYRNVLPAGVFPVALLFLTAPPSEVDVNVHPSKTEVRFRHGNFMHDLVRDVIRRTLLATRPVAPFPAARWRGTTELAVEAADVADELAEEQVRGAPRHPLAPAGAIPGPTGTEGRVPGAPDHAPALAPPGGRSDFHLTPLHPPPQAQRLPLDSLLAPCAPAPAGESRPAGEAPMPPGEAFLTLAPRGLPLDLEPLGQVQESFIVAVNRDGLWIIDQHAAHERVLFDRHVRQRAQRQVDVQRLLMPIVVELKPEQQATLQAISTELAANGFEIEPFGQRSVAVKTAPAGIPAEGVQSLMAEILDGARREGANISLEVLQARIAASVSCHAAIKVNMALEAGKMEWLLRELGGTDCPMTCPHGRPTILRYGMKELQKAFKRI